MQFQEIYSETDEVKLNLSNLWCPVETWVPNERRGFRLYIVEELGSNYEYILTEYQKNVPQSNFGTILNMGELSFNPILPARETVDAVFEDNGIEVLSDEQWVTLREAYYDLCVTGLHDAVIEGKPQVYEDRLFQHLDEFSAALVEFVDRVHSKIDRYENTENEYLQEYADCSKLSEEQVNNIGVFEDAIEWELGGIVPYASECQIGVEFEWDAYQEWEVRALQHMLNGVFQNKPALAKVKALRESGLTQKEIAEFRDKDPSTISRQVSKIENLESRAEWTVQQN